MTATLAENMNVQASFMLHLAADANLTAEIPQARMLFDGGPDFNTENLPEWIEPTMLQFLGTSILDRCMFQVKVLVRPGNNVQRPSLLAGLVGRAIGNKQIEVMAHEQGEPSTVIGHLRTYNANSTNLGKMDGLHQVVVEVDGIFTRAA